jgi:hypothetical protein
MCIIMYNVRTEYACSVTIWCMCTHTCTTSQYSSEEPLNTTRKANLWHACRSICSAVLACMHVYIVIIVWRQRNSHYGEFMKAITSYMCVFICKSRTWAACSLRWQLYDDIHRITTLAACWLQWSVSSAIRCWSLRVSCFSITMHVWSIECLVHTVDAVLRYVNTCVSVQILTHYGCLVQY